MIAKQTRNAPLTTVKPTIRAILPNRTRWYWRFRLGYGRSSLVFESMLIDGDGDGEVWVGLRVSGMLGEDSVRRPPCELEAKRRIASSLLGITSVDPPRNKTRRLAISAPPPLRTAAVLDVGVNTLTPSSHTSASISAEGLGGALTRMREYARRSHFPTHSQPP